MADLAWEARRVPERVPSESVPAPLDGGWITLLLHAVVMGVTATSILRVGEEARGIVLVPLALGGLLIGFFLARTPALDAISHILALLVGTAATLLLCAIHFDGATLIWETRGRNIAEIVERIVVTNRLGVAEPLPDDDQLAVIGLTLWLVGYSSAWMLYRRRWLFPALLVPITLVFVCLRFEENQSAWSFAVIATASLIMAARNHAVTRQLEWSRSRIPAPRSLAAWFTVSGIAIAATAVVTGWLVPYQAPQTFVDDLADVVQPRWEQAATWLEDKGLWPDGAATPLHTYSEFSDSFEIGKPFEPSDDPVVSYSGVEAPYLAMRRYDFYTGHGWKSDVNDRFRIEGEDDDVKVTDVTFQPGNTVNLTDDVIGQSRADNTGEITVLKSQGGLVFTTDTFRSLDIPYWAVMDWVHLDYVRFNVATTRPSDVHIQLRGLFQNLQSATFDVDPETGAPKVADLALRAEIEQNLITLKGLPVTVTFEYAENGDVQIVLNGRLPNYDDIEAVFDGSDGNQTTNYAVTGSVSLAGEDELRSAGTAYPVWVTDRYLQSPDSVTDRTSELAAQIINEAGATNSFDQAWAIQDYLRNNYTYDLNSDVAPNDQDEVDFFLFDDKIGRCEDYASAMVVMLRTQGIPARIVGGFRASEEIAGPNEFLYREELAHTWVEVYFPGYGWIPFEPTSSVSEFEYGSEQQDQPPTDQPPEQLPEAEPTPEPTVAPTPEATPPATTPPPGSDDDSSGLGNLLSGVFGVLALGLTTLAAVAVGGFAFAWLWSLRGMRPGASLFARTIRVGRFWGIEPDPAMTPREFALRFGQTVPGARNAAAMVAEMYSAERYGGIEISEETVRGGQRAWRTMRSSIFRWRPWGRRNRG